MQELSQHVLLQAMGARKARACAWHTVAAPDTITLCSNTAHLQSRHWGVAHLFAAVTEARGGVQRDVELRVQAHARLVRRILREEVQVLNTAQPHEVVGCWHGSGPRAAAAAPARRNTKAGQTPRVPGERRSVIASNSFLGTSGARMCAYVGARAGAACCEGGCRAYSCCPVELNVHLNGRAPAHWPRQQ